MTALKTEPKMRRNFWTREREARNGLGDNAPNCCNCRYWYQYAQECRRRAPTPENRDDYVEKEVLTPQWPETGGSDWCGEFEVADRHWRLASAICQKNTRAYQRAIERYEKRLGKPCSE